jgi:hypothetical protein
MRFPCNWRNAFSILQKKPDWSKKGDEKKVKEEEPPTPVEEWENWESRSRSVPERNTGSPLSVIVNNHSTQAPHQKNPPPHFLTIDSLI